MRLEVVWSELEALKALPATWESHSALGNKHRDQSMDGKRRVAETRRQRIVAFAVLATFLVAVSFGTGLFGPGRTETQSFQTDIGVQKTVSLSDGSKILLNTGSRMDVRLSPNERDIYLAKSEAYFKVAHDNNRPFVVFAGNRTVRAVGSCCFAVRLAGNTWSTVTVTERRS